MSPDVGYSFSNDITYYSTNLLIKYYKIKIAKKTISRGAARSAVIVVI